MKLYASRRDFLRTSSMGAFAFSIPSTFSSLFSGNNTSVKIGVIADLHQDIMHDGLDRMKAFTDEVRIQDPDAIFQLGDFAYPGEKNKEVIDLYNKAHVQSFHVIGNHDTDAGYTNDQCINYWGMKSAYYTTKVGELTFMVLDGNEKDSPTSKGGYASYIGLEQKKWLKKKLAITDGPIVIVSHQPLAGYGAIDNAEEIQKVLQKASDKILFAMNGHTHVDVLLRQKDVNYVHFNSASYLWVGGKFSHNSYAEEIHSKHEWISKTCPYKESLYAFVTIDLANSVVKIEGKQSTWVGSTPRELGLDLFPSLLFDEVIAPRISDRTLHPTSK